jgi:hypothetical protein
MSNANETGEALGLMTQVNDIGFTEFTSGLISSTFETLIGSALTQLQAYADLVASVSKTVAEYTKDSMGTDPAGEDSAAMELRSAWIQDNLVEPGLLAESGDNYTASADAKLQLVKIFSGFEEGEETFDEALGDAENNEYTLTADKLHPFVGAKLNGSAKAEQDLLITILKLGMQKLVVTDGRILSKLTFKVNASKTRAKSSTAVDSKSSSISAGANFRRGAFGASASYGKYQYSVNVVNETSSGVINVDAQIVGEVEIHFRTETFPQVDPQPAA